jgi:YVTN family beta-propeller protein
MLEFRLLGPIEAEGENGALALGSGKQRALLAVLLLNANTPVRREALIDALWGEDPPATADHGLDVYVSRLRKALGTEAALVTRPGGYMLRIEVDQVDAARFERRVGEGRAALRAGDPSAAADALADALRLWRGPALADVRDELAGRIEGERLEELRLGATEDLFDAELALGRHEWLVPELQSFVARHPLRERPRRQLMLALYRSGRQADALAAYQDARRTLLDELGVDPSPELRALERQILEHDLALAPPETTTPPTVSEPTDRRRGRRRLVAAPLLAVAVGAAVAAALLLRGGSAGLSHLAAESAGIVDGNGRLSLDVVAGSRPQGVAVGFGSAWVANEGDNSVSRIDRRRAAIVQSIPVGGEPDAVAVTGSAVWVANAGEGTVSRIDPATNGVVQTVTVGNGPDALLPAFASLWVANAFDGTVKRLDPASGRMQATIVVGGRPEALAAADGSIWATDSIAGDLVRIDPRTNEPVNAIPVGSTPVGAAAANGSIWVANGGDGTLSRVDPRTNSVVATVDIGAAPEAVIAARRRLWVAEPDAGRLVAIDPTSGRVTRGVHVGSSPVGLAAAAGDNVWVTTLAPPSAHRGGTLHIETDVEFGPVDPALYSFAPLPTNDGLVAFDHRVGGAGALVPDLARSLPRVSPDGRTYTFQLRPGLRYSTAKPVHASDVRFSIERLYKLRPQPSPYVTSNSLTGVATLYLDLVGERACRRDPHRCDLSRGIVADDTSGTVTFHLAAPDPNFVEKLTAPYFAVLPRTTPLGTDGLHPVAATGPYRVASVSKKRILLLRNSSFREWSAAAEPDGYPDRIAYTELVPADRELQDVLAGRADLMQAALPADAIERLETRYADRLHIDPILLTSFLFLNTRLRPFDDLDARRAVEFAIDRGTVARILRLWTVGKPTCQILAPNFPAYAPYCPYTLHPNASGAWSAPDVATARRLAAASGTRGDRVVLYLPSDRPFALPLARYLTQLIGSLGWPTSVRYLKINALNGPTNPREYFSYVGDSRNRVQAGWSAWSPAFITPASYLGDLLACDAFKPHSLDNANNAEFCDPRIQREIEHARQLDANERGSATALWTRIEHQLVDRAPIVPLTAPQAATVVSRRLGNYRYSATIGTIYDQYWVK